MVVSLVKRPCHGYTATSDTLRLPAGKHTDVTGMSLGVLPHLQAPDIGLQAYHIGYNSACKKPESLPSVFRWGQHPNSTTLMMVEDNYGTSISIPGHPEVLLFKFEVDNTGPPTVESVEQFWHQTAEEYPNAEIVASSLDEFALSVLNSQVGCWQQLFHCLSVDPLPPLGL